MIRPVDPPPTTLRRAQGATARSPGRDRNTAGQARHRPRPLSRGFSLMEVMLVLTIMGILISMSAPSFRRSIEQSRADVAGANLRAIWSAQRIYWLENRAYADNLDALESLGLIDPAIAAGTTRYVYAIASADADSFTVTATRTGAERWTGTFSIDEQGTLTGLVESPDGTALSPGYQ